MMTARSTGRHTATIFEVEIHGILERWISLVGIGVRGQNHGTFTSLYHFTYWGYKLMPRVDLWRSLRVPHASITPTVGGLGRPRPPAPSEKPRGTSSQMDEMISLSLPPGCMYPDPA